MADSRADSRRPEIRFARTRDGVSIAHARSGKGYPLVRTTHWMGHLDYDWLTPVWRPWVEALGARFELHRYDGRGCGLSEQRIGDVSLETLTADLEAVVDAAGLERFALLGLSQGASAAIAYAAANPERVSHLVTLGGFSRGSLRRNPTAADAEMVETMIKLVELGWGQSNSSFLQLTTSLFFPAATPEQSAAFNEIQRRATSPAQAARLARAFSMIDASAFLADVQCPTLVLHCTGDSRVPYAEGRFIATSIPNAQLVTLESPSHVPLQGEPAFDAAIEAIAGFVRPGTSPVSLPMATAHGSDMASGFDSLSQSERRILDLLARGLDNAQIAAHLDLSSKTVRNKVSIVFHKLQVENRSQAIVRARDAGFGR
jgi:pimeloyl-ACP methyl ester carboxylesterase/DNA-binding CsgD family transcriptional regulator